jgi:hypothetical protein
MNYISKLQTENKELKAKLDLANETLAQFHAFLHSDKFIGTETDGSRKDWIATGDVISWIREVRSEINA